MDESARFWTAGSLAHTVIAQFFKEGRSVEAMTDLLDGVDRVEIIENIVRAYSLGMGGGE